MSYSTIGIKTSPRPKAQQSITGTSSMFMSKQHMKDKNNNYNNHNNMLSYRKAFALNLLVTMRIKHFSRTCNQ